MHGHGERVLSPPAAVVRRARACDARRVVRREDAGDADPERALGGERGGGVE